MVHARGAVWRERVLTTQVKHSEEILKLLEAVLLPREVTIMHCKGHQKGETEHERGNRLADQAAERVVEQSNAEIQALIPEGKVHYDSNVSYTQKGLELANDL